GWSWLGRLYPFLVRYPGRESSHIGLPHWLFGIEGEGGDSALRCVAIGLYHRICCAEIISHFAVGNEIRPQNESFINFLAFRKFGKWLTVFVEFSCNE